MSDEQLFESLFFTIAEGGFSRTDSRLSTLYRHAVSLAAPLVRARPPPNGDDPEEIIDTVFLKIVAMLSIRAELAASSVANCPIERPAAYFRVALRNAIIDAHRVSQRSRAMKSEADIAELADSLDVEQQAVTRELVEHCLQLVRRRWDQLHYDAFYRRYVLEQSDDEIAKAQRTTVNNVQQRISRVRRKLSEEVTR